MPVIPNNVDWSATAAWIALVISILGTIASPLITTHLTNQHQLKLRELDIKDKELSAYQERRRKAIENFLSFTAAYFANYDDESRELCCKNFFFVYPYVPKSIRSFLNQLYDYITNHKIKEAQSIFNYVSKELVLLLEEERPQSQ